MPYYKVNSKTGEILSGQMTLPDQEFIGLSDDHLADLGATFPDRPELQDIGYWLEVRVPLLAAVDGHMPADVWTCVGDIATKTVTASQQSIALTPTQVANFKRAALLRQLAATDAAFQPRWAEDLAVGHQYAGFIAWKANRDDLRAQLAALPPTE